MAGFIKLYRGWRDCEVFTETCFSEREAWLWLLENAAWKDTCRRTGQGGMVQLERGQIHVSLGSLSSAWGWSIKRVRGFLARLEKGSMLGTVRAQSGTIITITNYRKYQDLGHSQGTEEGTVRAQSGHTQEEGKEIEEERTTHYAFFGRTIKLNSADLDRWRKRYHGLNDLEAELGSLDDWITGRDEKTRKNWFHIISGSLNKKHQASLAEKTESTGTDWW